MFLGFFSFLQALSKKAIYGTTLERDGSESALFMIQVNAVLCFFNVDFFIKNKLIFDYNLSTNLSFLQSILKNTNNNEQQQQQRTTNNNNNNNSCTAPTISSLRVARRTRCQSKFERRRRRAKQVPTA